MLKLNCLLKNTTAAQHIKDAMEMIVGDLMDKTGYAKFPQIYKAIREAGIEVDAESVGSIYNGLYGGFNDQALSTTEEVEIMTGAHFEAQMNSVVLDIMGAPTNSNEQQIGTDSPEKHAINTISKMFQSEVFGSSPKTNSVLKQMQDLITKAATSLMEKTAKPAKGLTDALTSFFNIESNQFKTLSGQMNTMKDLHDAVKKEVENYVDQVALKLENEDADLLREQWDKYTEAFINSTYDIILGKGNQNSLVNGALQQISEKMQTDEGINIVDLNGAVKWSALIEHNNPDTITDKVKQLFKDGYTKKDGSVTNYTDSQAERIGNYFQRLYETKLADAKDRALQNNRVKNMSAKNIISDFIKDRGFFNLVKDKQGDLNFTQADWDNAIKSIRKQLNNLNIGKAKDKDIRGLDLVQQKLRVFLNSQTKDDGSPKFNAAQKKIIEDEFVKTALAKLVPATAEPTSLERLVALDKLNSSKAFNNETQQALNKVVGVSGLNQNVLDQIRKLAQAANSILEGGIVTGQTSTNPAINRAAYAYTALVEIDRKIKEILRQHKIDNSQQQRVVKYLADVMGGGTVSLLLNPNNILENVTTQLFTNIGETVNMAFNNPKLFAKTFGTLQGDFWTQWWNYAQGGASNEIANESDLSSDIQSSERLRARSIINEVKDKGYLKGILSIAAKSAQYGVSIFSRVIMNSFDAATTTSLMRKKMIQGTYDSLIAQGKDANEVIKIMNNAFNIPANIDAEIKAENKMIGDILKAAGFPVNNAMLAQNERDMRLSVYEDVIREEGVKVGASLKQATEITKALVEASQKQAKALGGKRQLASNDIVSKAIYAAAQAILIPQKLLFASSRKSEELGKLGQAARMQLAASVYQNTIGRFVGGVANFMTLAITATPVGFIQGGVLFNQKRAFAKQHAGASDIFNAANPEDIKRYAELHGTMRSILTRATMGTIAFAAFAAKALASQGGDDDDKEATDWFANLMATKSGRRAIQKHLPVLIAMVGPAFYKTPKSHALDMAFDMLDTYTGKDFDEYTNLRKSLKFAGNDEDEREDVWAKYWGNKTATYNVNQAEQVIKFFDVLQSAIDVDKIGTVEENEAISKEIYKSTEGIVDNFLINGAIDAARRIIDPGRVYNRYTEAAKGGF